MNKTNLLNKSNQAGLLASERGVHRIVLLTNTRAIGSRLAKNRAAICTRGTEIQEATLCVNRRSIWISCRSEETDVLAQALSSPVADHAVCHRQLGSLLMLEPPRARLLPVLRGWFGNVIGEVASFKMLPIDQLLDVFSADMKVSQDVLIGGSVDRQTGTVALVRGNLDRLTVPLTIFRSSGNASPDPRHFELDDFGRTLRFGSYEATADLILWEADREYRKRAKARQRAEAEGLGPSLRRLRIQRGLSQSDFPGVTRKTISRIEKGDVEKPHVATLRRIATSLGVQPEDIESY